MVIILLTKKDGTQEEVELIMTFKIDKFNSDYVFYRNKKNIILLNMLKREKKQNPLNLDKHQKFTKIKTASVYKCSFLIF